jgi:hypothetical protein
MRIDPHRVILSEAKLEEAARRGVVNLCIDCSRVSSPAEALRFAQGDNRER